MIAPGAFAGIAVSGGCYEDGLWVPAEAYIPLPPALLVHWSHDWCGDDPDQRPVGIAVPELVGPEVRVRGVFASTAWHPWNMVIRGLHDRLSIVTDPARVDHSPITAGNFTSAPGGGIVAAAWPLVAVDFVPMGADEGAGVTEVYPELTDAEREVQARLNAYLADPRPRLGIEYLAEVCDVGVAALEPLRALVKPMLVVEVTA